MNYQDARQRILGTVRANIRAELNRQALTYTDLCKRIGYASKGTIGNFMSGPRSPTINTLALVAAALDVDPLKLMEPYHGFTPEVQAPVVQSAPAPAETGHHR